MSPIGATKRTLRIFRAFARMGWVSTTSYPLASVMNTLSQATPLVTFLFLSKIVSGGKANVGHDFYTFFVVGLISAVTVTGAVRGLSQEMDETIQQGRMEMLLIEPVPWRVLPVFLSTWQTVLNFVSAGILLVLGIALGAHFRLAGMPAAAVILCLGVAAGVAIAQIAASARVLAKKSDPIFALYGIAAAILSGQFFPLDVVPRGLRSLSWLVPNTYVNSGIRHVVMPHAQHVFGPGAWGSIVALLCINAVLFPLAVWLFGRSLDYGRKMGVLAGY